jgi:16S rRNA (guanine1207-N2)-methyltransferase
VSDHYFTNRPTAAHEVRTIAENLRGFALTFLTDSGVFSKGGIDFGSRLLIESMEIPEAASVLDIGCGYGPIGITAAKLARSGQVTMVDVNERALELARLNAEKNGVANVEILQSDLYENLQGRTFDRILTNPPIRAGKAVVHQIFTEAVNHLNDGGELWVVIQKKQGAPSARKRLEEWFGTVNDVARDAGYRIFQCQNPVRGKNS